MSLKTDEMLDRCIETLRSGGDPETILREHLQSADEVRSLLALVSRIEALPSPQPSPEAMMNLVARVVAHQRPARAAVRLFSPRVLAMAAGLLLCVLLIGWGSAAASSDTVPGDLLYPLKLFTERVKFFLTLSADDQVELRIVFSEERMKEAVRKYKSGDGVDKALLTAMLDEAKRAVEAAPQLTGNTRDLMVTRVAHMTELQHRTIKEMTDAAGAAEREDLRSLAERCAEHCAAACRMMGISEDTCPMCGQPVGGAHDVE